MHNINYPKILPQESNNSSESNLRLILITLSLIAATVLLIYLHNVMTRENSDIQMIDYNDSTIDDETLYQSLVKEKHSIIKNIRDDIRFVKNGFKVELDIDSNIDTINQNQPSNTLVDSNKKINIERIKFDDPDNLGNTLVSIGFSPIILQILDNDLKLMRDYQKTKQEHIDFFNTEIISQIRQFSLKAHPDKHDPEEKEEWDKRQKMINLVKDEMIRVHQEVLEDKYKQYQYFAYYNLKEITDNQFAAISKELNFQLFILRCGRYQTLMTSRNKFIKSMLDLINENNDNSKDIFESSKKNYIDAFESYVNTIEHLKIKTLYKSDLKIIKAEIAQLYDEQKHQLDILKQYDKLGGEIEIAKLQYKKLDIQFINDAYQVDFNHRKYASIVEPDLNERVIADNIFISPIIAYGNFINLYDKIKKYLPENAANNGWFTKCRKALHSLVESGEENHWNEIIITYNKESNFKDLSRICEQLIEFYFNGIIYNVTIHETDLTKFDSTINSFDTLTNEAQNIIKYLDKLITVSDNNNVKVTKFSKELILYILSKVLPDYKAALKDKFKIELTLKEESGIRLSQLQQEAAQEAAGRVAAEQETTDERTRRIAAEQREAAAEQREAAAEQEAAQEAAGRIAAEQREAAAQQEAAQEAAGRIAAQNALIKTYKKSIDKDIKNGVPIIDIEENVASDEDISQNIRNILYDYLDIFKGHGNSPGAASASSSTATPSSNLSNHNQASSLNTRPATAPSPNITGHRSQAAQRQGSNALFTYDSSDDEAVTPKPPRMAGQR